MMRRYLLIITLGWMLPLFTFVSINWLVDPYRIFHKPWVRDNYYPNDTGMRAEAAGIINTEDFDSIILGTSMADNFSAKEADQIFGAHFVNISLRGSTLSERSFVLSYVLHKRAVKNVIYSLDIFAFDAQSVAGTPMASYTYLYDDNPFNDLVLYASSPKIFRYALCRNIVVSSDRLCQNRRNDLETLVEWHSIWEHSKRFGGLNKWLEAKDNPQIIDALTSLSKSIRIIGSGTVSPVNWEQVKQANVEHEHVFRINLLDAAISHPDTRFYFFFPPYSRLNYAILKQSDPQRFEEYLGILRFVVNECAKHPNIHVFGFETEDFLDDIANYKDTEHYHQRFNSAMLHWMKNGEHELTPNNLEPYIQEITARAAAYRLREIGAKIDSYVAKTH